MLATETYQFGANTTARTIVQEKLSQSLDTVDSPRRVFKGMVYNEGDNNITLTLEGSVNGSAWTSRATVTVKARSNGILSGAVRGTEEYFRITVSSAAGESQGRLEIFDASGKYKR